MSAEITSKKTEADEKSTFTTDDDGLSTRTILTRLFNPFHFIHRLFNSSHKRLRHAPEVAGILIPFVCLLSIPTLTEDWLTYTDTEGHQQTAPKERWLIISLSISLALAILANICLAIRFFEHRVYLSTLTAITLLILRDVLSTTTSIVWGITIPYTLFAFSEGFWCSVASSIFSTIVTVLLVIDFVTTAHFKHKGSGLTSRQRLLVNLVILLIITLAIGALIFSELEKWSFIDGLFFSLVTIFTIGFGDLVPRTTASRIIVVFYATFGIVVLGWAITAGTQSIFDGFKHGVEARRQRIARRRASMRKNKEPVHGIRKLRLQASREEADELIYKINAAFWTFISFWLIGAMIFQFTEPSWTYFDSMYFCFIAFSSIGYGDFVPQSLAGRACFIGYAFLGVGALTFLFSVITECVRTYMRTHVKGLEDKGRNKFPHKLASVARDFDAHMKKLLLDPKLQPRIVDVNNGGPNEHELDFALLCNYRKSFSDLLQHIEQEHGHEHEHDHDHDNEYDSGVASENENLPDLPVHSNGQSSSRVP